MLLKTMNNKLVRDNSHKWGEFLEVPVTDRFIMRSIRIFDGGKSSIHRHETTELLTVESGTIICLKGFDEANLIEYILNEGDTIFIDAFEWHRIEYVKGEFKEENISFAQIVELMFGDNKNGDYFIDRFKDAKPSKKWLSR
ncbi:cupin domain-containing protein [Listeria monocytogenes]|nr:cupin domain-containing protein [Listeria monocytogenes]